VHRDDQLVGYCWHMRRAWSCALVASLIVCAAARQIVIDVGGHPNDFLALGAVLKMRSSSMSIRHITVHGNSGASLSAAYNNIRELVNLAGRNDVVVYPGAARSWTELPERRDANASSPGSITISPPTSRNSQTLPTCGRSKGIAPFAASAATPTFEAPSGFGAQTYTRNAMDTLLGVADALPVTDPAAAPQAALDAVLELLRTTPDQVEYIALGSLTNLAEVLLNAPENSRRRLAVVHISGGSLQAVGDLGRWLNGQAVLPATLNLDPQVAPVSWNFLMDPVAAQYVLTSNLPFASRYVYTLDATKSVIAAYTSTEFIGMTTGAMKAAANMRAQGTRIGDQDATLIEFLAALTQSQRVFADAASSAGSFDARYFNPVQPFVVLAALDPTGQIRSSINPRERRLSVDRKSGQLYVTMRANVTTADESFVVDSVASASPFWDNLLGILGLSRSY
jgi:inosine-uridine nucleoside N-ribohydrolase